MTLVLLLPAILIVGPSATPAFAEEIREPGIERCVSDGEVITQVNFDGTLVHWICHIILRADGTVHRYWSVEVEGPHKTVNKASARPDSYTRLNVLLGRGNSNGIGIVGYQLYSGNATSTLIRQLQVRLLVVNRTTGGTCIDTGWQGPSAAASHTTIVRVRDLPSTCGGRGYYEAVGNGRFLNIQNQWISTGWVNSGRLFLAPL